MQRDQLADEEAGERLLRLPAGREDALLGADEADGDPLGARPASAAKRSACACVSQTTRSAARNARRSTSRAPARPASPRRKRPRSSTSVSASETSGLKTTGAPRAARRAAGGRSARGSRRSPRRSAPRGGAQEPRLGAREPRRAAPAPARQLVLAAPPRPARAARDLDPGAPQARDHLRVARIRPLVRARSRGPSRVAARTSSTTSLAPASLRRRHAPRVARDHLADQPEREQLDADDDEQDAEDQQRPAADRVALRLQRRSGRAGTPCRRPTSSEPEPAEQVQRPVPVAADERDGEQVEEAAQVALEPVARAAVLARPVVDRAARRSGSRAGGRAPG